MSFQCSTLTGRPSLFSPQTYNVPEFQPCVKMDHQDEDLDTGDYDGLGIIQPLQTHTCPGITAGRMKVNSSEDIIAQLPEVEVNSGTRTDPRKFVPRSE